MRIPVRWLGQPLETEVVKVTLDYKAPVAGAIMLDGALMVFDWIPVAPITAVMIRSADGAYGMLPQCRLPTRLSTPGNHRALCRHGPDVPCWRRRVLRLGLMPWYSGGGATNPPYGRCVFCHFVDDDVYQQYGYGGVDGSDSLA